jgi:hypothetical protein
MECGAAAQDDTLIQYMRREKISVIVLLLFTVKCSVISVTVEDRPNRGKERMTDGPLLRKGGKKLLDFRHSHSSHNCSLFIVHPWRKEATSKRKEAIVVGSSACKVVW